MGVIMKIIDNIGQFTLGRTKEGYIVINNEREYESHSHFYNESGARKCVDLINRGLQPRSRYFQKAAIRLIGEEEYSELVETRKEKYININKGRLK